jgi:hypothetical protein
LTPDLRGFHGDKPDITVTAARRETIHLHEEREQANEECNNLKPSAQDGVQFLRPLPSRSRLTNGNPSLRSEEQNQAREWAT